MNSIRSRLAIWIAVAIFATAMVFGAVRYVIVRDMMVADFNRSTLEQLHAVANSVKVWTDGYVYVELNTSVLTGFAADGDRAFVVRNAADQELIAQSESLDAARATMLRVAGANVDSPVFGTGIAPNGKEAVVVSQILPAQWDWDQEQTDIEIAPGVRDTHVAVTVAVDRTALTERLERLVLLYVLLGLTSSLTAAGLIFLTVRKILHPLQDLADRASEIQELSYDARFPTDGPVELRPIAERLNDLFVRLSDAAQAERHFTSNAAHELRTPVAELRTLTEIALRFPTAPEQLENVIKSSNVLSVRLSSLIDALLGIARKDALSTNLQMDWVDAPQLLRDIIADNAEASAQRELTIDLTSPHEHQIMSDATLLQSILINLIDNALAYAPFGSTVWITYEAKGEDMHFSISNLAPDVTSDDVARMFEPFWRKEGQRPNQDRAGLGLALCEGFAEILNYKIKAALLPKQVFKVTLRTRS